MTHSKPERVVLVDEQGAPAGTQLRRLVHHKHTPLHLAVHAHLFDRRGRLLLTRRSLDKVTWPGVWSNSVCGHVRPGEPPLQAVLRSVTADLGAEPDEFWEAIPDFRYRAADCSGLVENEWCSVWVGVVDPRDLDPDPEQVAETMWVRWKDAQRLITSTPGLLTPWSVRQLFRLAELDGVPPMGRASAAGRRRVA